MSATEAVPASAVAAPGNPGTADGSPQGGTERTDETAEQPAEGESPEVHEGNGKDPFADKEARYQAEIARRDAELADVYRYINQAAGQPEAGQDPIDKLTEELFGKLDKGTENEGAWKNAMAKALRAAADAGAEKALAAIGPKLQGLDRAMSGTKYERALSRLSGDPDILDTPEFQRHEKEMERAFPSIKLLRENRSADAADWVWSNWAAKHGARVANKGERDRIERAKGAAVNGNAPRGSATSAEKLVIAKNDPELVSKTAAFVRIHGVAALTNGQIIKK